MLRAHASWLSLFIPHLHHPHRQRRPRCRVNVIAEPALNLAIFRPVFGAHQAMVGVLAFAGFR
ncbi:hypothetical protein, partial [Sphingobium sp. WCS2017Hpa-17]|uniref:hypothetical protein n=1 Tax=Sphingobium sp. WCS2017Hpa-17 TaxID=3073638 RepID=UPI00288C34D6